MSSCTLFIYALKPLESESISAMPIMPMLPAKLVRKVRAFFVSRLSSESESAVKKDIPMPFLLFRFCFFFAAAFCCGAGCFSGAVSETTSPSWSETMRVAYFSASSGLCVTMMTSFVADISFKISIICTLVAESSAPVGSSARSISGSFTSARAMATRCICPPESWLGFFFAWSAMPTRFNAASALSCRSARETPESVSASSTFAATV